MPTVILLQTKEKNLWPILDNPGFYICLLHKSVCIDFWIFSVFIFGLFISNMAALLQAKPNTLEQFILKHTATSRPKTK